MYVYVYLWVSICVCGYDPGRFHMNRYNGHHHHHHGEWSKGTPVQDREVDLQGDRDWYDSEEGSGAVDLTHNQFLSISKTQTLQLEQQRVHPLLLHQPKKYSARHEQRVKDTDRWEASRLQQSGLQSSSRPIGFNPDMDEDHRNGTVYLIIHERTPSFLPPIDPSSIEDNNAELIRDASGVKVDPVNPVRDPTSDIAQMARKGSPLVQELREKRERAKRMRSLAGGGTTLGGIMGRMMTVDEEDAALRSESSSVGKRFADLLQVNKLHLRNLP